MRTPCFALVIPVFFFIIAGCGNGGGLVFCEVEASAELRACIAGLNEAVLNCFASDDGPCAENDANVAATLATLEDAIDDQCAGAEAIDDPDFTTQRTPDAWVARFTNACQAQADALEARSFGGPQGAAWADGDMDARTCLALAHAQASEIIDEVLALQNSCITDDSICDVEELNLAADTIVDNASSTIGATCDDLPSLIAVNPSTYANRALAQTDCITATAFADASPLELDCGPEAVSGTLPRGEYMQVVLDRETYGTRCGDGSDYAFQVRLAPEGEPLDKLLIALEGGGVCLGDGDCRARFEDSPDLFEALSDEVDSTGIMSDDPDISPFANWTKVFLPYCTQDVFIGGGVSQTFEEGGPPLTIERYGAPNTRASVRYVRDLIWGLLDASDDEGYRADRLTVLFGGFSAGSFGTLYNYHYVLDDIGWAHTAAFPDAGFALDNGDPVVGIIGLGTVLITGSWLSLPYLPSYCFDGECAAAQNLLPATAPRLRAVPEQQMLMLSNQNDLVQVTTTFFFEDEEPDTAGWVNALRQTYCDTKNLNGVQYYLTSETDSVHVVSPREEYYTGSVDGIEMRDWLDKAITDPDNLQDRVEEGDFVTDIPGVDAFPCAL